MKLAVRLQRRIRSGCGFCQGAKRLRLNLERLFSGQCALLHRHQFVINGFQLRAHGGQFLPLVVEVHFDCGDLVDCFLQAR